ncbi:MAG TPA: molybdopterin-binding protein [Xanthobacteraceae bacterium]|jgi:molybdopterin biosynthesis enzyme
MTQPDAPQRIGRLTPVDDLLDRIAASVARVEPRPVDAARAAGRILAADLPLAAHPRVALALRDGWAVSAELASDASSYAPVAMPAASRVDAGEPLPPGTDAVAALDTVIANAGRIEVIAPLLPGEGVLPAGRDLADRGATLPAGTRLSRLHAAALAVTGAGARPLQVCEPRVHVAASRPGDPVIDAAAGLIAAAVETAGGQPLRPQPAAAGAALDAAFTDAAADAVIGIGGTGSGRNDRAVQMLARRGRVDAHGLALAPGETAAFGFVGPRPVLLLPGRLDAAIAVWLVIGRRLMGRLTGAVEADPATRARLSRKIASALGLVEVVPVCRLAGAAEPLATTYLPLAALVQADGWVLVPADSEGYPPGSEVVIRPWL